MAAMTSSASVKPTRVLPSKSPCRSHTQFAQLSAPCAAGGRSKQVAFLSRVQTRRTSSGRALRSASVVMDATGIDYFKDDKRPIILFDGGCADLRAVSWLAWCP
eukprot:1193909-Prorocentrum_minimum.AAC.2